MSFRDQGWEQRLSAMGDEAEGIFESVCKLGFVRFGLNRPPLQMHRLPARIRFTPDYLMSSKFVEVQGLGRDQVMKLKLAKHGALHWWADLHPVELFIWDSKKRRYCYVTLASLDGLLAAGKGALSTFYEGNAYFAFQADDVFLVADKVGVLDGT